MRKLRIFNINNTYGLATGNLTIRASIDATPDLIEEIELPDSLIEQFNQDPSIFQADFNKRDKRIRIVNTLTKKEIR